MDSGPGRVFACAFVSFLPVCVPPLRPLIHENISSNSKRLTVRESVGKTTTEDVPTRFGTEDLFRAAECAQHLKQA